MYPSAEAWGSFSATKAWACAPATATAAAVATTDWSINTRRFVLDEVMLVKFMVNFYLIESKKKHNLRNSTSLKARKCQPSSIQP